MSPTLGELAIWGKERLKQAGIEDFEISAELILRSLSGLTRTQLILAHNQPAESSVGLEYKALIERRAAREPLQYLVGWTDFYNVTLKTDKRALIPRPETEILVETILTKLKNIESPTILDIGAGSGNISIALAKNLPRSHVTSLDISRESLELAKFNVSHNKVADQIIFRLGDILDPNFIRSLGVFDCVVSNPPYVAYSEKGQLQPEITLFEPEVAVFSGDNALIFFKTIISSISYILKTRGLLAFEVGNGQAHLVADMMADKFNPVEITPDLAGIERVVTGIYAGHDQR